jgi:hypothetical protein
MQAGAGVTEASSLSLGDLLMSLILVQIRNIEFLDISSLMPAFTEWEADIHSIAQRLLDADV